MRNMPYTLCLWLIYIYVRKNLDSWLTPKQQLRYQPVADCSYWPVLDSFNNWNIITLSHKAKTSEALEDIHQVVLDRISKNMYPLVQYGKYGAINTTYTSTMGYNGIQFVSEA